MNDTSDLSSFTSDPTGVCFCENGIPDCYRVLNNRAVHPGERFYLSLALVGYGLGTVPGSVIARGRGNVSFGNILENIQEVKEAQCQDVGYSIVSKNDREQIALAVDTLSFTISLEKVNLVVDPLKYTDNIDFFCGYFLQYQCRTLLPNPRICGGGSPPVSSWFPTKCICHQMLRENNIHSCTFSNGTALILRPAPYWIGLPNDTHSSILIHPHCPYDYCKSVDIYISVVESQCQYQRSGVLCGSCAKGLSMMLGSSECSDKCSNLYLLSIGIFIVTGVALVAVVTLLNMIVSVGTLNGLILVANIL